MNNTSLFVRRSAWISAALTILTVHSALGADFPSSYNLVDHDLVTRVEDQGDVGDCWAFASTTTFESAVLKSGLETNPYSPNVQLSQWHLATRSGITPVLTPTFVEGRPTYEGWGGNFELSIGYYTRGQGSWNSPASDPTIPQLGGGAVRLSSSTLNDYPLEAAESGLDLTPYVPPVQQPVPYGVRNAYLINKGDYSAATQVNRIKTAITNYGAVGTLIYMDQSLVDPTTHTYIYTGSDAVDHAVTIVGWDDTKVVSGATSNGAWLIQNSWGDDWAESGYFWISYEDTHAGKTSNMALEVMSMDGYSETVLQNQLFYADEGLQLDDTTTMQLASILTSSEAGVLDGIGIVTHEDALTVTISIYVSWDNVNNIPSTLLPDYTVTTEIDLAGYHLVNLEEDYAYLAGQEIVVVVTYDGDVFYYDDNSKVVAGVSYVFDGENWVDVATLETPGTLFLKGYTLVPEPAEWAALAGLVTVVFVFIRRRRNAVA